MTLLTQQSSHVLKTDPIAFAAVKSGAKTCELRKNDRNYQIGDMLVLMETQFSNDAMKSGHPLIYTGKRINKIISHIQTGYGLPIDWCILSFGIANTTGTPVYQWQSIDGQQHDTGRVTHNGNYFASTGSPHNASIIAEAMNQTVPEANGLRNVQLIELLQNIRTSFHHPIIHTKLPYAKDHYYDEIVDAVYKYNTDTDTVEDRKNSTRVTVTEWEENAKYLLDNTPGSIRIKYKGGPENLLDSLVVTYMKLRDR